jgi:hypothetical protein
MRRRSTAVVLSLAVLGTVAVTAQAAPRAALHAPTVAYRAVTAVPTGVQPANKATRYTGTALRFAGATTPRGMGEPTVGVTKRGTVYTTTIEFDGPGGATGTTVIHVSRDGGRTFKPVSMGVAGTAKNPATLDPYVYVDPDFGRAFSVDLAGAGSLISWTDDTGESKGDGFATVAGANDHQTLTTGVPPKGNPLMIPTDPAFPKIVYYCVNTVARIACSHSLDGGRTYVENGTWPSAAVSTTGGIICGSLHGHIVTDRDGRLFLPRNECGKMVLGVSEDGGLTWANRTVTSAFPGMDPDASVAVDKAGNVYYVWYDGLRALPYLSVSKNHGVTWSAPVMIAPPGVTEAWFPVVEAGDNGKIAVWFMGSRSTAKKDTRNTRPWNMYAAVSTDALKANPTFVSTYTNTPGDPIHRGDCGGRCGTVFDFLDLVAAPNDGGRLWGVAVDSCTKLCAEEEVTGNSDEKGTYGKSNDNVGRVFRQVSGPALRSSKPITSDTRG